MNLAVISVAALVFVVILSCFTKLNVGVLSIAMAWLIGVYLGGFKVDQIAAGFPVQLFLTLVGITLLFTQAQLNGTLDKVAHRAVRCCRGKTGVIPIMFFFLAAGLASIGPGNIATAALIAPMAMTVGGRVGVPAFLMAIMVGNGANAGSLSPFAPTGIIVSGLMTKIGLPGLEWQSYWTNLVAHAVVAFGGYLLFGGLRLLMARKDSAREERYAVAAVGASVPLPPPPAGCQDEALNRNNWITLAAIFLLIASVIFLKVNVGMGAFAAAGILAFVRAADHANAIQKIPWNVIVMVCGVTVLIAVLEKTQGLALFTDLLARMASRESVTAAIAFTTGLVSVYSSTSGVVLPAFLPTVPGLASQLGANPVSIALAINVGGHLVDVSPLSTIGALCIASAPIGVDARKLFNSMLAWGMSMTVVGAALCYVFFRP
jgi:Na+/H+ antiporter NhaD/arsenite permease-like protein